MTPQTISPLNLFALAVLAGALLWSLKMIYGRRGVLGDDPLLLALTVAAWGLLLVGTLGALSILIFPGGIVLVLVALVILAMVVGKYRDSERRALLWVLAISAERQLPLAPAARAFAAERIDESGWRALRLANLLEAGMPLPEALRKSGNRLPVDAQLAVQLGHESGSLGAMLNKSVRQAEQSVPIWQSLFEKSLYAALLLGVAGNVLAFFAFQITPVYLELFADSEIPVPEVMQLVFVLSRTIVAFGVFMVPIYLALLCILAVGVFYYMGWLRREPRVFLWLTRRAHTAHILRCLSYAARQGTPLPEITRLLARCYPNRSIRAKLARSSESMEKGQQWSDSLQANGLISRSDAAVLRAAQRVGNLAWALEETADSNTRRLAYRMASLHQIAFPIVLLLIAMPVALYAVAVIYPLAQMVEVLARG